MRQAPIVCRLLFETGELEALEACTPRLGGQQAVPGVHPQEAGEEEVEEHDRFEDVSFLCPPLLRMDAPALDARSGADGVLSLDVATSGTGQHGSEKVSPATRRAPLANVARAVCSMRETTKQRCLLNVHRHLQACARIGCAQSVIRL
jgi:hypothetical protein